MVLEIISFLSIVFVLCVGKFLPIIVFFVVLSVATIYKSKYRYIHALIFMWITYAVTCKSKENFNTLEDLRREIAEVKDMNAKTYEQTQKSLNQIMKQQVFLGKQLVD